MIALCAMTQIVALIVVGFVSDGLVRHLVQTSPSWIVAGVALNQTRWAKWIALPVFAFWLVIMVLIWLYLLGVARILTGHYSDIEIAMTAVVGAASVFGILICVFTRTGARPWVAALLFLIAALIQVGAMSLSLRPQISSDTGFSNWLHGA